MRVDFNDGQWAEIYTAGEMPRLVTVRLQDMLVESVAEVEDEERDRYRSMRNMSRLRDTLMALVVKDWSYTFERTGESAEDMLLLPQDSYDVLHEATREHFKKAGFFEPDPTEEEEKPKTKRSRAGSTSSA